MSYYIGDWNAKVEEKQVGGEGTVGKFGMAREKSDKGERFVAFCALNNLAIVLTMFPHIESLPNGHYHNQIYHVAVTASCK